ncbi:MAG: PAS domain S-box protein [Pseudomonadota bacterium]|nr:PAS domain S-box protein [Pseudomonadota bacterium]
MPQPARGPKERGPPLSHPGSRYGPLAICAIYVVLGALWILLSDQLVLALSGGDADILTTLSTGKGWAYVFGSGALLYGLVLRRERAISGQVQLLSSILHNIGDCVIVADSGGHVTARNPAAEMLFGAAGTVDQLVGWYDRDGTSPLAPEAMPMNIGMRGQSVSQVLVYIRNQHLPSGGCFSVTGRPMVGRHGETVGVVVVLHDLTDIRRAEERVRSSESLFHSLARLAPVGIFRCDAAGLCIYVNERWCEFAGTTAEAAHGRRWLDIVHPDDRDRVADEWGRCTKERAPCRSEFSCSSPDGRVRWLLAQTTEEVSRADEVLGHVGTLTDITEKKTADDQARRLAGELERRIDESAAQLQVSSRELDAFSYSVSHDLRAPLRTVSGFSQLVLEESGPGLSGAARSHLARVIAASGRMGEIIDGLLNLARVTRSRLHGEWVDVSAVVDAIFEELRNEDPERIIETRVAPGLRLWGDPILLRIAIENLLRNAWKFTRHTPGARVWVHATAEGAPGVVVCDNGAGFDMAWVNRLFRAFERLHTADEFPGSGIGLATVHRIVTRHGGRIWANGAVGQGACFSFTVLPGPTEALT